MNNVILIIGLPASGKTTLANSMSNCIVIDDQTCLKSIKGIIRTSTKDIVITDPMLCIASVRESAISEIKELTGNINLIYFENNPSQCLLNAKNRINKDVTGDIKFLTNQYKIPKGTTAIPVYSLKSTIME